ncbi:ankyrin [Paraphaeosphaeria sporulosa]|uniref:Ankyrin n=1 Tax=Paraphaeosphaeria sporulosa TaxID=1460663 RepID=A0A177CGE3_9PLEO|nr:ankyrin [Paraphaeosphaeria sporulosa]OAG06012.1 ankyrin [Paraphaeosphaeria sporulosa]
MRKRDRMQNRVRALFTSDITPSAPPHRFPLPPAQQASSPAPPLSSPPCPPASSTDLSVATTPRSLVLEKALAKTLEKLPQAEKAAFAQASKMIDERTLLSRVHAYDAAHKDDSSFRPHAERLSKFLILLDGFMGGVAIGIQASPEISSLVVGSVRVVIDLALKFTMYFSKLSDMICTFEDYLGPLAEYGKAADISLVETTVVNAYANVLGFGRKARRVFVDAEGNQRKWTSLRAFMRQHWETFESEFATIKEDLQHHLDVLLHSVQSLHFDFSRKVEQARRREEEGKERSAFLTWLSSIDFEKTHQDTFAKKHEKTCDWLIKEPKYQQWFTSPASSLLWCHGKPGIGKSVLASNVIEDITTKIGLREDAALCFAYYNYRDARLKELHQIVTALLKQLCRRKDQLPRDLLQTKHDALPSSLVGTQERFRSLIEDLPQVYVVFDALDECPEQERGDILGFITGIVTAQVRCHVKVFVTSRNEMDIAKAFGDRHIPTIQIQTENVTADIETFARSQVEKLQGGEHGKTLYVTNDGLKEKIVRTLATKAEGMFLWVNLQLDSLCQASKAQKDAVVEAALDALPQGLPDTYVRILERIEAQTPYMRDLAINCLAWTLYTRRPLSTRELQLALAVNSNCKVREDLQTDSPQVILEACANLLEEANGLIRPIHYTVQEFLTTAIQGLPHRSIRAQLLDSKAVHTRLSLACIAYIRLTAFGKPARDVWGLHCRFNNNSLASYPYQSFDYHIIRCEELSLDVINQLETILRQESASLAAILQIKVLRDGHDYWTIKERFNRMDFLVTPGTIVYSTSLYNVPTLRQKWVEQAPPTYALHLAASAGLTSAVNRLLEAGCDINEKDSNDSTPLYYACSDGDVDIAQVLIDMEADINVQGGHYGNALQAASSRGHEAIVKLLLDKGAEAASCRGHEAIVKLLLDKGAEVNAQGGRYGNALQAASSRGHEQVVEMLLNAGARQPKEDDSVLISE